MELKEFFGALHVASALPLLERLKVLEVTIEKVQRPEHADAEKHHRKSQ